MNEKIANLSRLFYVYNPKKHYCQNDANGQHWVIYENSAFPRIVWMWIYHYYNE